MDLLDEAIIFATHAHGGQVRKLSGTPYILHPLEVSAIISTMTGEIEAMAAGALHDTIEDCGVLPEEIRDKFGSRVFALVQSETEDKMSDRPPSDTWLERKQDSLLALENTRDAAVRILWLADKLSNLRSFYREYLKKGDDIWLALNQKDKKMQEWYYRSIADCLSELSGHAAYIEFVELINKIFGGKN